MTEPREPAILMRQVSTTPVVDRLACWWVCFLIMVVPCLGLPSDSLVGRRPNIVFILTDDQGYGDMSCHGHPVLKTPNIDRLHDEGVRFTDFHVSPTCSPTRAALFTGRHEFENGVTHTILERERLTLQATTLAQVLKSGGLHDRHHRQVGPR